MVHLVSSILMTMTLMMTKKMICLQGWRKILNPRMGWIMLIAFAMMRLGTLLLLASSISWHAQWKKRDWSLQWSTTVVETKWRVYPTLARLAKNYLASPASSAPSDWAHFHCCTQNHKSQAELLRCWYCWQVSIHFTKLALVWKLN